MKLLFIKSLKKIILSSFSIFIFVGAVFSINLINPVEVSAQTTCTYIGQCINNSKCECPEGISQSLCRTYVENGDTSVLTTAANSPCGSAIIGGVTAPGAISEINIASGGEIGLISFISRAINFANIVAGILVMLNFVYVGFLYITGAGNSSNMTKMNERLTWSFVGIIMIVGSYTLAAIFGLIFYSDPTFIISPTFTGALELQ